MAKIDELIIKVTPYSEGGFSYDVYKDESVLIDGEDALDGGIHTGEDIEGALDSAVDMAKELIKRT